MIKREFTAVYQKRGDHYIAWVEEIPGTNTQGSTKREIRENLKELPRIFVVSQVEWSVELLQGMEKLNLVSFEKGLPVSQEVLWILS